MKFRHLLPTLLLLPTVSWAQTPPTYLLSNVPESIRVGQEFTVYLLLDLGTYPSAGTEVSLSFPPDKLSVVEAVELGAPPYQLNLTPGVRDIDNTEGVVEQFEAVSFWPAVPPSVFVIGEVTFRANQPGTATVGTFPSPGAGVLDEEGLVIPGVDYKSTGLQIVPTRRPRRR